MRVATKRALVLLAFVLGIGVSYALGHLFYESTANNGDISSPGAVAMYLIMILAALVIPFALLKLLFHVEKLAHREERELHLKDLPKYQDDLGLKSKGTVH